MKLKFSILFLPVIFIMGVCYQCKDEEFIKVPDTGNIDVNIKFHRFDKALFSLNTDSLEETLPALASEYGDFFNLFTYRIIGIGGYENKAFPEHMKMFLTDRLNIEVYNFTSEKYKETIAQEKEINEAFRFYKYYFPDSIIPEIYFYVSRFNHSVVTDFEFIGIGLDKYLGSDCHYYKAMELPGYIQYKMNPEMMSVDCMKAWISGMFAFDDTKNDVVSNMIYKAKIQYMIKAVFPEKHDSLLWGFTGKQVEWCNENESNIWLYLIDNNILFSTDYMDIKRYTEDGPFTTPFTDQSPARACVWIGYKLIIAYMKNNPDVTIQDLMAEQNYMKILNDSYYEP